MADIRKNDFTWRAGPVRVRVRVSVRVRVRIRVRVRVRVGVRVRGLVGTSAAKKP